MGRVCWRCGWWWKFKVCGLSRGCGLRVGLGFELELGTMGADEQFMICLVEYRRGSSVGRGGIVFAMWRVGI
jgi:hypothetical protein